MHGHDLDAVRCLACRVEALRGFRLGTITIADDELPRSLEAVRHIQASIARAFQVPAHLLRAEVPATQRCWQCAALGVVTQCVPGEIYCEPHRLAVERAVAES